MNENLKIILRCKKIQNVITIVGININNSYVTASNTLISILDTTKN